MKKLPLAIILGLASCVVSLDLQAGTDTSLHATFSSKEQRNVDIQRSKAKQGDAEAMARVGRLYAQSSGREYPQDFDKARYWLDKAIEQGNTDAFYYYAKLYEEGTFGKKDPVKAFEYYQQGADAGNLTAMYFVFEGYRDGKGVKVNLKKAQQVMDECVEKGGSLCSDWKRFVGTLDKNN
ncbi:sel1 repeat family protein [Marinomonas rhizomae]|uniref:tetratricopeptide repeat protein n=1 Tax=Marinomonas rhizomae TaxID=491948 RepID=UPI00210592B5|nr:tetratricopeptide repeat protein [Marinomonas rhizomae]UTV97843.1 sel1 repeat family protein [Marinomonas rhizomae]